GLEREAIGEPSPQLDLQSVIVRERIVDHYPRVGDEGDDEEEIDRRPPAEDRAPETAAANGVLPRGKPRSFNLRQPVGDGST
ncbi:MAG: hypothetical protein ACREAM_14915, partial [Blastocatellia bacterium]